MLRLKLFFHIKFWLFYLSSIFFKITPKITNSPNRSLERRIDYYNKLDKKFKVTSGVRLKQVPRFKHNSAYFYDFYKILSFFSGVQRFHYILGDIKTTPTIPTFVKARPINKFNKNSILLPLNTWRHFIFVNDNIDYEKKISKIVWRGASYQNKRKFFLKKTFHLAFCDVGCTAKGIDNSVFKKEFMSIKDQLKYKFIFSVEGNDVASNLKWILNSNSLCFMQKPTIETWAMEGLLEAGVHYVELNNDFSNLESQYLYYLKNPEKAKSIIRNANKFINQIKDESLQLELAIGVAKKYFRLSDQA
jgi:hypothetical protein